MSFLGAPYSLAFTSLGRAYAPGYLEDPPTLDLAMILGVLLLLLFLSSLGYLSASFRNFVLVRQTIGWLMIGVYSISSALLTMFGRLHHGVEYSLQERYVTYSLYLAVSLIPLVAIIFTDVARGGNPWRGRLFATTFASLITLLVFLHLLTSIHWEASALARKSVKVSEGKVCLLLINVVQDEECLANITWWKLRYKPDELQRLAIVANKLGFLRPDMVKSNKIRDIEGVGSGSVTYGGFDILTRVDEDSYLASGWAISPKEERPADAVILTYEDASGEPTMFAIIDGNRTVRSGIVKALDSNSYRRSGWEETFSASMLPAGSTELRAWAFDAEAGKAFELEGAHKLEEPR